MIMKIQEKIDWLKTHFFADWMKTRIEAEHQVSNEHTMFCVCGKLATGLHELYCSKFRKAVDARCVELMKDRLPASK